MITILIAGSIAAAGQAAPAAPGASNAQHGQHGQHGQHQQGQEQHGKMAAMKDCSCCKQMMDKMHSGDRMQHQGHQKQGGR